MKLLIDRAAAKRYCETQKGHMQLGNRHMSEHLMRDVQAFNLPPERTGNILAQIQDVSERLNSGVR